MTPELAHDRIKAKLALLTLLKSWHARLWYVLIGCQVVLESIAKVILGEQYQRDKSRASIDRVSKRYEEGWQRLSPQYRLDRVGLHVVDNEPMWLRGGFVKQAYLEELHSILYSVNPRRVLGGFWIWAQRT